MIIPDFPFDHGAWLRHSAGLGQVPAHVRGTRVAVVGAGVAGTVVAHELARLGLVPVVHEAVAVGGRMRSVALDDDGRFPAELGAMRFARDDGPLMHYVDELGLACYPFPNPLSPAAPRAMIDAGGRRRLTHREALPADLADLATRWDRAVEAVADQRLVADALAARDAGEVRRIWGKLVESLDELSLRTILLESREFPAYADRELFGTVGFGSGGWDTDFDNGVLEVLRVVVGGADRDHVGIVGGCQQVPVGLWEAARGHGAAELRGAVTALETAPDGVRVRTTAGAETFAAVVSTAPVRHLLVRLRCSRALLTPEQWRAAEQVHYMSASKVFVPVDRAFWLDPGRSACGPFTTLTDRFPRATYLFGDDPERPGTVCLSYTWNDDSHVFRGVPAEDRAERCLEVLDELYPDRALRRHVSGAPVAVTWDQEPYVEDAFSQNLPGHYRGQRTLACDFVRPRPASRALFLAGDDVSWTGGFADGAVASALNAVWGVVRHLGGRSAVANPGPGDVFADLAPVRMG